MAHGGTNQKLKSIGSTIREATGVRCHVGDGGSLTGRIIVFRSIVTEQYERPASVGASHVTHAVFSGRLMTVHAG